MGCEQHRIVEARDADDDPDRLAHPEADQPFATGQHVERHRLAMQSGDLLGGSDEGEQGAIHLDAAVPQRLPRLEDEELLDPVASRGQRRMCAEQGGAPDVRREGLDLLADRQRLLQRTPSGRLVTDRSRRNH